MRICASRLDRGYALDAIFREAQARGLYFKLVISEKAEFLLGRLPRQGLPDRQRGHFSDGEGSAPRRLHEYYWRHMFARYGAFRAMHSWETVNEDTPDFGGHFRLAAALAKAAAADGNPHPATLSTWASLGEGFLEAPRQRGDLLRRFPRLHPQHGLARAEGRVGRRFGPLHGRVRPRRPRRPASASRSSGARWASTAKSPPDQSREGRPRGHRRRLAAQAHLGPLRRRRRLPAVLVHRQHLPPQPAPHLRRVEPLHGGHPAWPTAATGMSRRKRRNADVRVLGQKDLQAGRAHLWIDNRNHTWKAVVDGRPIPPVSGTVTVDMEKPRAAYNLTWYDTATGKPAATRPVEADRRAGSPSKSKT